MACIAGRISSDAQSGWRTQSSCGEPAGLKASEHPPDTITDSAIVDIAESQEPDGSWPAAIRDLQEYSIPALKIEYLLSTQFPDGSWYVRSRAIKFQPYFESGFPFGHDQWISVAATA